MSQFRIIRFLRQLLMNRLKAQINRGFRRGGILTAFIFFFGNTISAQCPVNLGFESGNFGHWETFAGAFDSLLRLGAPPGPSPALASRHTIFKRSNSPGKDPYGQFPIMCPNGSEYTIRLGNDSTNGKIDGVSYLLTVPSDKDVYSIIYNYAVVFQDPAHTKDQQPRFTARVFDVGTNEYIECSSFDFSASSDLPGFRKVNERIRGDNIFYKPWTPVTIKLIGYAGKQLKIEFTASDCTLGAHFGYAYLDVNEDCTTPITGNTICNGVNSTVLIAPYGFREYNWYTADFSKQVGSGNTLRLDPLPAAGTKYALELLPYPGSGCLDTLYTTIQTAPIPFKFQVVDSAGACPPATVDLTAASVTAGSSPGLIFSYFTDSTLGEYVQDPKSIDSTANYYIKAVNNDGCLDLRPVITTFDTARKITVIQPPPYIYPQTANLTDPALYGGDIDRLSFSFWKDLTMTIPVSDPQRVDAAGNYFIKINTRYGCTTNSSIQVLFQIPPPPNAFSPNNDGINDVWLIPGLAKYDNCSIDVFDRTGRRIYHSVGYNTPWNGMYDGKPLPVGTYYYVIKTSDKLPPITGSVTMLR